MKTLLALLIVSSVAFAQAPHGTDPAPKPEVKKVLKKAKKSVKKSVPVVAPASVVKPEVKK